MAAVTQRLRPELSIFVGSVVVIATGVVFSFGGLAFRITDDIGPWQYVMYRGAGAAILTAAILGVRHRGQLAQRVAAVERDHVIAGLSLGFISTIFIVALDHASVAFVLFLQSLAPLTAAYFSWLLLRERISRAALIATLVSIGGVAIMVSATLTDTIDPLGLIALAIPVIFGLYATLIRGAATLDPQMPVLIGGLTLVVCGIAGSAFASGFAVSLNDAMIGLGAGALLLALPVAVLNMAAQSVPAPEVALLLLTEVILAPVWVWLFVDETPAATTLIGGAIILAAVLGLLLWRRSNQPTT